MKKTVLLSSLGLLLYVLFGYMSADVAFGSTKSLNIAEENGFVRECTYYDTEGLSIIKPDCISSLCKTSSSSSFTNKYRTPTTKCAHNGCNKYIAYSGDTNCCTTHSNRCLSCKKYIDEDAMYCMDCLKKALGK